MNRHRAFPYLIKVITVIGLVLYIIQSWYFANSLHTIGDEGAYLYKGYLFARGDVRPFEAYTFWTNKSPLSFLIPGYIQLWFGPGLREARYFSIVIGSLMMVGIWVTAQRLGGEMWAAAAVWIFALYRPQISIYSEAVSQNLVACLMAWMFALTLGENQKLWQLILGSVLAILIVMTRQNMILVPALLVLYIFWQYGNTAGMWSLITSAVLFIGFHIIYWPNIMVLWASWFPRAVVPFLDQFRVFPENAPPPRFNVEIQSRWQSLSAGLRDSLFIFVGSASALALFPGRHRWKSPAFFKMAVFTGTMFFGLFLMHTMASIFTDYCVYCFSGYQMFYSTAGLFFILLVCMNGLPDLQPRHTIILTIILLFFAAMVGLYHYQSWSDWLLDHIRLPRVNALFQRGEMLTASLRDVFQNSMDLAPAIQKRLASLAGGVILGCGLLLVMWFIHCLLRQRGQISKYAFANVILVGALTVSAFFPFVTDLSTSSGGQCSVNYVSYYERAGESLAGLVPAGSVLYWRGSGRHLALMLYVQDAEVFLPQIHAGGGYVSAPADTDRLLRLGLYNQEIDTRWRDSADFLAIWQNYMTRDLLETLQQRYFEQIPYDMGELSKCEDELLVFRRTQ